LKLSKRLQHIEQMIPAGYSHIWDCCCDHGLLGASLLSHQVAPNIHFVDIVPELMRTVKSKLEKFYVNSASAWQTHCLDVEKLPLSQYQGKQLVIIAGVGGDLILQFINEIYHQHAQLELDFILCPVNQQYDVRQRLIALNFSLKNEVLVEENRRFYEVMFVSSISDKAHKVSAVGNNIWRSTSVEQAQVVKKYLEKTLSHYTRVQQGNTGNVDDIISAYRSQAAMLS